MARPPAAARLGFYPLADAAVPLLLRHMGADRPENLTLLDPCAGEGAAIEGIARGLGVPETAIHCVELDEGRSRAIAARMPGCKLLGPATYIGTRITHDTFSLVYCNPPYDHEIGGGRREELTFLVRAYHHCIDGGLCAFVFPEDVVFGWQSSATAMRAAITSRFKEVRCYRLPREMRPHRETVILGVKRPTLAPDGGDGMLSKARYTWGTAQNLPTLGDDADHIYRLKAGRTPRHWAKEAYTPEELRRVVLASPLGRHLSPPAPRRPASPPLPLAKGHVALILASGNLDGLVRPEGEPPHVVRGTARKVRYLDEAKSETTVHDDGSVSDKQVFSERIVLTVRAVGPDGAIRTFTDTAESTP